MGWQVIIAPAARSDLTDTVRYIAQHNSATAARLGFELITRAESLMQFPEIGRMVPEFRQSDLCEIMPLVSHHLPAETSRPADSNRPLLARRTGISAHPQHGLKSRTAAAAQILWQFSR